ncbi:MAG: adenylate/guanylate cyclase domain-containing protein [Nitrososphaerales archaeon]
MKNFESGDIDSVKSVHDRVSYSLENKGLFIDLSTDSCRKYLQRKVNTKTNVVVMYVDIAGSTQMSHDLPSLNLALIIQIFSQEVSLSIEKFGGYVLKFMGDAVIGLFPSDYDQKKAIINSLDCARYIQKVMRNGINPVFKKHSIPEIAVKIGIEYGSALVLLYGKNIAHAYIDLIGFSISIAAKITSLSFPGEVIVGENIFHNLDEDQKKYFIALYTERNSKWDIAMRYNNNLNYRIYKYIKEDS